MESLFAGILCPPILFSETRMPLAVESLHCRAPDGAYAKTKKDFGNLNTYFARLPKVFIFERNRCSSSAEITVHLPPKQVFTFVRNGCSPCPAIRKSWIEISSGGNEDALLFSVIVTLEVR